MAFIQRVEASSGSAASTTVAQTITSVVAGRALVVFAAGGSNTASTSVSSDVDGAFTEIASITNATEPYQVRQFVLFNASSGSHVVTATFTASINYRFIWIEEHSGLASAEATGLTGLRQTTGTTRNAGTYGNTSDGYLVGLCVDYSWLSLPAADTGAGFTDHGSGVNFGGETTARVRGESQSFTGAGSRSATFTGVNTGSITYAAQGFFLTGAAATPEALLIPRRRILTLRRH